MARDELNVRLVRTNGEPLLIAEVLIDIRFYIEDRCRYQFVLGRTDDDGVCRTSFENIQSQLEQNRRFFLMDYNTPLDDCDSEVGIFASSGDQIGKREAGRAKSWPENPNPYLGTSNHLVCCLEQKFKLSRGRSNTVDLICEPNLGSGADAE